MSLAVQDRLFRVLPEPGPVHGLNEMVLEIQGGQSLVVDAGLRVHHFQLTPRHHLEFRAGLGAHANPIDSLRNGQGAVGLHGDFEPMGM